MRIDSCYSAAAWLAGLAVTLVLASWLTPREWWRRPTLRNLCIAGLGTWAFGSLILHFASAPLPQLAQAGLPTAFSPGGAGAGAGDAHTGTTAGTPAGEPTSRPIGTPNGAAARNSRIAALPALTAHTGSPGSAAPAHQIRPFRVHRDLNLRAAASVDAQRLALVPAGASVLPTGARSGDWWEVRTLADGQSSTGWVSSLWLRRTAE
ncbi:SH3 domain-containing protein [Pseudoduganella sp. UC29_71]|uniref:SH3 domain-containing protein n=1 Tax=Pseudoduganella sp. UC29_71 TaxID=3350174 RepID=UPI00366B0FDC